MASYTGTDKRLQFLFDMVSNFAQDYDSTQTYGVGAYAIYMGVLYKCITAVTVAEDFDDTKWTQVLVMNEIGSGGGSTVTITPTLSSGTKIADFSINGNTGELYAPSGGGGGGSLSWGTPYVPSVTFKNVNDKYTAQNTGLLNIFVNPSSSSQRIVFKVTNNGVTYSAAWANNGDQNMIVIPINAGDELTVTASSYISSTILTEIPFNLV